MVSTRPCLNFGGPTSALQLALPPQLEIPLPLDASALAALEVWRGRPGEIFTVSAPDGGCYRARLHRDDLGALQLIPFAAVPDPEMPVRLTLFQALPEKERFELILQKGVELGAAEIVPFHSRHSTRLAERDARQRKSHRWPEVILRAARQSRRRLVPGLFPVLDWSEMLSLASRSERACICHPAPSARPLLDLLASDLPASLALIVGPEGGFSDLEVSQALDAGCELVALGPRLLRTETAAICALSLAAAALERAAMEHD